MKSPEESKQHLDKAIQYSSFNLGQYLDDGYNLWKRKPLSFVALILLLMMASVLSNILPFAGSIINSLIISPCLTLGAYLACKVVDYDIDDFKFEDFFSGFQFVSKAITLNLIIIGLGLLLALPLIFQIGISNIDFLLSSDPLTLQNEFPVDAITSTTFLLIIPLIYAGLLTSFALPILGIYRLEPWDALRYSALFIHKHWIMFFFYYIVIIFIMLLGFLALIIGVVITVSMLYPMIYISFKDITDLDTYLAGDSSEIETHQGATLDDFR